MIDLILSASFGCQAKVSILLESEGSMHRFSRLDDQYSIPSSTVLHGGDLSRDEEDLQQCSQIFPSDSKVGDALTLTLSNVVSLRSVTILLGIHVYFFSVIGMILFPPAKDSRTDRADEGTKYFADFPDAVLNLIVLLTTANNPDGNPIFFSSFLGIRCVVSDLTGLFQESIVHYLLRGFSDHR